MYKAVFIDMDGTLLRKDHTISPATKKILQQLTGNGILVVPISARPLHGMLHIIEDVFPKDNPVVSLNGSYIYHNGAIVFEVAVSIPEAAAIHNEVSSFDATAMYYSRMEWFASDETAMVKKEQKITPVKIVIQPFKKTTSHWEMHNIGVNKILIAGDKKLILDIEERLLAVHSGTLNIYKSQPAYLEVMHAHASKANAIRFLLNRHGIQQHETIAIGDNYNDKGMIEFAKMGVAMGNAPDEIKAVADYVTDTNNNDGVAKALQHFFGL
jgi:Cof subfamily protein (haloacid dehalogenase superfamily)